MVYNKNDFLSTSPWVKPYFIESAKLTDEDIAYINKIGEKKQYVKDSVLIDMGSRGEKMYFIQQGTVRYSLLSPEGTEKPVTYVIPGGFVGDAAFVHKQPTLYHAVAMEFVEAIKINQKNYWDIISRPGIAHIILKSISMKGRVLATQIEDLAFRSTIEKVCRLLWCLLADEDNKRPNTNHITQQELASLAGAHRVSITNALSQLKKEGLITTGRDGSVVVKDIKKLRIRGFGE